MGRDPIPTERLLEQGTWRTDRHAGRSVEAQATGRPVPPATLTAEQQAIWNRVCRGIPASVAEIDQDSLLALVEWWAMWRGYMAEAGGDYKALAGADKAWKNCQRLMSLFGMSPVDRCRLRVAAEESEDELDDLLRAG